MQKKKLEDCTSDELNAQKKTLKAIIYIMMVLVVLYLAFFIYKLVTATWEPNNTLGAGMLFLLAVIISLNSSKISGINKELERRSEK